MSSEVVNFEVRRNVLSPDELEDLVPSVHEVVMSAFGKPNRDIERTRIHIKGDVILGRIEDKIIAFSNIEFGSPRSVLGSESLPDADGCYFAAAAVSKDAQGKGVYQAMNAIRFDLALQEGKSLIFTRTQNPLVETAITHELERIKQGGKIKGFSLERMRLVGVYDGMLTSERPFPSQDSGIQRAYDELEFENGDAYLLLFYLTR